MSTVIDNNPVSAANIDELGDLLKQIKELTAKSEKLKKNIKNFANLGGERRFDGESYSVLYTESNVSTVDYKGIVEKLKVSADVIADFTSTAARFTVKVDRK